GPGLQFEVLTRYRTLVALENLRRALLCGVERLFVGAAVSQHQIADTIGVDAGNAAAQIIDAPGIDVAGLAAAEAIAARDDVGRPVRVRDRHAQLTTATEAYLAGRAV